MASNAFLSGCACKEKKKCKASVGMAAVIAQARSLPDLWGFTTDDAAYFRNKAAGCFTICYKDGIIEEFVVGVPSSQVGKNNIDQSFAASTKLSPTRWRPASFTGRDHNAFHSENMIIDYAQIVGRGSNMNKIDKILLQVVSLLEYCDPCASSVSRGTITTGLGYDVEIISQLSFNARTGVLFQRQNNKPPFTNETIAAGHPNYASAVALTGNINNPDWFKTFTVV